MSHRSRHQKDRDHLGSQQPQQRPRVPEDNFGQELCKTNLDFEDNIAEFLSTLAQLLERRLDIGIHNNTRRRHFHFVSK